MGPPPMSRTCGANGADGSVSSDAGADGLCFYGTVTTTSFTATVANIGAYLYAEYPSIGQTNVTMQTVAADGTWAFGGLPPGPHYYVEVAVYFAGLAQPVTRIVGPLTVAPTAPLAIDVKPVQLDAFETRPSGGIMNLQWARAHVFAPATGYEITGTATVTITVGGTALPLPWDMSEDAYFAELSPAPVADLTYIVTASDPALGPAPVSWELVANPPSFDGAITAPAPQGDAGVTVAANEDLTVNFVSEPNADGESIELFTRDVEAGTWDLTFPVATMPMGDLAEDAMTQVIPAASVSTSGEYLLNVAYLKSNCPVTADGCLTAATVSALTFSAEEADAQAE